MKLFLLISGLLVCYFILPSREQQKGIRDLGIETGVLTPAPLNARNLKRLAKRAMLGLAQTGGIASNGSGDYVIAFSTATSVRVPYSSKQTTRTIEILRNDAMYPLFMAVIEATEEAILNSLFLAVTVEGRDGHIALEALSVKKVLKIMSDYGRASKE